MIASFLITFRETLEAALVVGIILGFLVKTKNTKYHNIVYTGIGAGVIGSIISALLFSRLAGGFSGRAEEIFEGVAMLVGAFLLTTMILWMMNQKNVAKELKQKVSYDIANKDKYGLFFLVFISVLREGVETVIFLGAASFINGSNNLLGGLVGVIIAIVIGYLLFVASVKINIKKFFNISSFLLILFAAGLTAHGVHEFQEAKLLPIYNEHVYDINFIMNENGFMGSLLKGLFGYNGNPSLLEIISYLLYFAVVIVLYKSLNTHKPSYN